MLADVTNPSVWQEGYSRRVSTFTLHVSEHTLARGCVFDFVVVRVQAYTIRQGVTALRPKFHIKYTLHTPRT